MHYLAQCRVLFSRNLRPFGHCNSTRDKQSTDDRICEFIDFNYNEFNIYRLLVEYGFCRHLLFYFYWPKNEGMLTTNSIYTT